MNVASALAATLDRAIGHDQPTVISIEGHGSISIYPRQRSYTTDIRDWRALPLGEGGSIRAAEAVWGAPPADSSPVSELRWRAAYHQACSVGAGDPSLRGLAKLRQWPDLSTVPADLAPTMIRICALLWRKRTATVLMARILETDAEHTWSLLAVLRAFGHVEIVAQAASEVPEDRPEDPSAIPIGPAAVTPHASVIAKLWHRLVG